MYGKFCAVVGWLEKVGRPRCACAANVALHGEEAKDKSFSSAQRKVPEPEAFGVFM